MPEKTTPDDAARLARALGLAVDPAQAGVLADMLNDLGAPRLAPSATNRAALRLATRYAEAVEYAAALPTAPAPEHATAPGRRKPGRAPKTARRPALSPGTPREVAAAMRQRAAKTPDLGASGYLTLGADTIDALTDRLTLRRMNGDNHHD